MRIIAGTYRSRLLTAPKGLATRPTSDRLRETLFNVLGARVAGAAFLDLFAGSGAVGLEALSRGAAAVTFVDCARPALTVLRANLARLGVKEGLHIHAGDVSAFLRLAAEASPKAAQYEIVFLDPPYDAAEEYARNLELLGGAASAMLAAGAVVVAEHRRKQQLEERYGVLTRTRLLEQGDASLSFYTAGLESSRQDELGSHPPSASMR